MTAWVLLIGSGPMVGCWARRDLPCLQVAPARRPKLGVLCPRSGGSVTAVGAGGRGPRIPVMATAHTAQDVALTTAFISPGVQGRALAAGWALVRINFTTLNPPALQPTALNPTAVAASPAGMVAVATGVVVVRGRVPGPHWSPPILHHAAPVAI